MSKGDELFNRLESIEKRLEALEAKKPKQHSRVLDPDKIVENIEFPYGVIEGFNQMITENWNGLSATFKQDAVRNAIVKIFNETAAKNGTLPIIWNSRYFNVEPVFQANGWNAVYDKPGYNEIYYEPFFRFSKKE